MGFELTTDRYPPIMSQTRGPLPRPLFMINNIFDAADYIDVLSIVSCELQACSVLNYRSVIQL